MTKKHITIVTNRDELCILQQALGLRESMLINSTNFTNTNVDNSLLLETKKLRKYVIKAISDYDKQNNCGCK